MSFSSIQGQATVKINPRHMNWTMDEFLITKRSLYMPEGIVDKVQYEKQTLTPSSPLPLYYPKKGEHPRIYFTKDKIDIIKEQILHPENKYAKDVFESYVEISKVL